MVLPTVDERSRGRRAPFLGSLRNSAGGGGRSSRASGGSYSGSMSVLSGSLKNIHRVLSLSSFNSRNKTPGRLPRAVAATSRVQLPVKAVSRAARRRRRLWPPALARLVARLAAHAVGRLVGRARELDIVSPTSSLSASFVPPSPLDGCRTNSDDALRPPDIVMLFSYPLYHRARADSTSCAPPAAARLRGRAACCTKPCGSRHVTSAC